MKLAPKLESLSIKNYNTFNYIKEINKPKVWRERLPHHQSIITDKNIKEVILPEAGSFNPGMVAWGDKYIFVYRPDEYSFIGCLLDQYFNVIPNSYHKFNLNGVADPRLIWHHSRVLMTYSRVDKDLRLEHIKGCYIWEDDSFVDGEVFRISKPSKQREKNWTPFAWQDRIFFIGSTNPLKIYDINGSLMWEHQWNNRWFNNEFMRGNTPLIKINNGYLGLFHTVETVGRMHLYDNGVFLLKDKPPFRMAQCSNVSWSCAEDALYPHFRKKNQILLNFPCGMVNRGNDILISFGENDSRCCILKTYIDELLSTTVSVY